MENKRARQSKMKLLKTEFDNFDGANYWVAGLSKAINTSYIPSGNSIEEVVANFLKIQFGRSFSDCGFGSANLEMAFNENAMTIEYSSTSGTFVFLQYCFDNQMKFKAGTIECDLPDDRVGGCHYEAITEFIYIYKWSKNSEAVVPQELVDINPSSTEFPTPTWVLDSLANCRAENNPNERDAQLLEFGYIPVPKPIGFERAWENSNPDVYYPYIVLSEKYSSNNKNYFILKDGDCVERDYSVSYRRLLEILTEPPKSKKERQIEEVGEDEDYDYDESEYTDAEES